MQVSTITTSTQAIVWTSKSGKAQQAHGATAQAFAPRAARITAATSTDLAQLANGQYRPFLKDVAEALTKADVKALQKFGFELAPTNKQGMLRLLTAISGLWSDAKGKRKALGEVARAFVATQAPEQAEVETPLPPLDGVPADVASVADQGETPLPAIDAALL